MKALFIWLFPLWVYAQEAPSSAPTKEPPKGELVLTQEAPQSFSPAPTKLAKKLFLASTISAGAGLVLGMCALGAAVEASRLERLRFDNFSGIDTKDVERSIALTKTLGALADLSFVLAGASLGAGLYLKHHKTTQVSAGISGQGLVLSVRF